MTGSHTASWPIRYRARRRSGSWRRRRAAARARAAAAPGPGRPGPGRGPRRARGRRRCRPRPPPGRTGAPAPGNGAGRSRRPARARGTARPRRPLRRQPRDAAAAAVSRRSRISSRPRSSRLVHTLVPVSTWNRMSSCWIPGSPPSIRTSSGPASTVAPVDGSRSTNSSSTPSEIAPAARTSPDGPPGAVAARPAPPDPGRTTTTCCSGSGRSGSRWPSTLARPVPRTATGRFCWAHCELADDRLTRTLLPRLATRCSYLSSWTSPGSSQPRLASMMTRCAPVSISRSVRPRSSRVSMRSSVVQLSAVGSRAAG